MIPILASALAAILQAAPAPEAKCLSYDSKYEVAPLMRVRTDAPARLHLQDRAQVCQPRATCPWMRAGYVVPGDVVLASAPRAGFRCVLAAAPGRIIAGFLPDAALQPEPQDGATLDRAWLTGRWSDGSNHVVFSLKGGRMFADGDGVWAGGNAAAYGPNTGEFHGPVVATRTGLKVVDDTCEVTARRRGPFLIFNDDSQCGGMNVRFTDLYTKGHRAK